ncbi:hypothetical protein ACG9XX_15100 [Acinetobacter baumannii]|uniref:hypothetical protein n=1 Tax=Acinetobacter baumannii TaxID=470 RepID=UPI002341BB6E|nr:hypothetical protein [Acinetobacter baumannii]MDC5637350.1 hypothetical protein [Acinetobacter baumannii]HEN9572557.1 hypothetical protein [Acinetobacter baumannii]
MRNKFIAVMLLPLFFSACDSSIQNKEVEEKSVEVESKDIGNVEAESKDTGNVEAEDISISVSEACSMLNLPGMTSWKDTMGEGTYRCISSYIDISPDPQNGENPNNLAYYVEGTESSIKELKVVLNVNDSKYKKSAETEFIKMSESIYKEVANQELPSVLKNAIKNKTNKQTTVKNLSLDIETDKWENGAGYSQRFYIKF